MRDEKDKDGDKLPKVKAREDYVPGQWGDGNIEQRTVDPKLCDEIFCAGTISFPRYDYKCRVVMEKELEEKAKAAAAGGEKGYLKKNSLSPIDRYHLRKSKQL